jgi:hypothetical protein
VRACACVRVRVRVDRRCASQLELSESLLTKADRRLSRNVVYAQSAHICAGTGLAAAHICTGTGLAERVSAPAEAESAGATHRPVLSRQVPRPRLGAVLAREPRDRRAAP